MSDTLLDLRTFVRQIRLMGTLTTRTALRIGAGRSYDVLGDDVPVVKDTLERPVIPGSSLKGALRAYAERLLRTLEPLAQRPTDAPPLSCDLLTDPCLTNDEVKAIKDEEKKVDERLRRRSCWACRLFGAPWMASRVLVKDLPVQSAAWTESFAHRDGVSIDRDKGTAQAKRRYTLEVVPQEIPFVFELVVDGATDAELGLLLLALEGLNTGMVLLGGARSRGLGDVHLAIDWTAVEVVTAENALDAFGERALGRAGPTIVWTHGQRDAYVTAFFRAVGLPEAEITHWRQIRSQREVRDDAG